MGGIGKPSSPGASGTGIGDGSSGEVESGCAGAGDSLPVLRVGCVNLFIAFPLASVNGDGSIIFRAISNALAGAHFQANEPTRLAEVLFERAPWKLDLIRTIARWRPKSKWDIFGMEIIGSTNGKSTSRCCT